MSLHYCGPFTWTMLRALRRTGLLGHLNFKLNVRISGRRYMVPIRAGIGMNLLVKDEAWMHILLEHLLSLFPGTFVDVGVNVGQTLTKVKAIEPQRDYVGFEPNPVCIHYAQELARLNGCEQVRVVPTGLSDRDGLVHFEHHTASLDDPAATLVSGFRPGFEVFRKYIIAVLRMDTALKELGNVRIGIVKIDVEGGEREVLLGMEDQLKQHRPAVVLEILAIGKQAQRLPRQEDVEAVFKRARYRLHRIGKGEGLSLETLHGSIGVGDESRSTNYLALPEEISDAVIAGLRQGNP